MELTPHVSLLNLAGKTAIVTGGSLGIGFAISSRLAEAGAHVVIANRNEEESNIAASKITAKGYKAVAVKTDVSVESDVVHLVEQTLSIYGSIDILVNNAGIYPNIPIAKMTLKDFDNVLSINLKGVFLTTKYVSEQMIKQGKGGKIINVTSIDALHPSMIGLAHYDASKHGVWGFTKNVALELSQHNIWVNAIAPGGIMTEGVKKSQGPVNPNIEESSKSVSKIY
jgi:NAD(P)-dependent dehydrogenase (short-subunit alcohol dehydrogenase family)